MLKAKWTISKKCHCKNKLLFDQMIMMADLYYINMISFFYSPSSLKKQCACRHVAILRHIILIPREPAFALTPYWCVLNRGAANTQTRLNRELWTSTLTITPPMWLIVSKHDALGMVSVLDP